MLDDRRIKVRDVAQAVDIFTEGTYVLMLNLDLGKRKLTGRWMPCLLTKCNRNLRKRLYTWFNDECRHMLHENICSTLSSSMI